MDDLHDHDELYYRSQHFREQALEALQQAQQEAERFSQRTIDTEHLLLGLLDVPDSTALRILNALGVEPDLLRIGVENTMRHASHRNGNDDTGLTPRAKYALDAAVDEARRFNHDYVGTEHLLFGLVREAEGIAAKTLKAMGVSQERLRKLWLDTFGRLNTI